MKEGVVISCLLWMSGLKDALKAGSDSVVGDVLHVGHGVYMSWGGGGGSAWKG
jgi:hypothetical protein